MAHFRSRADLHSVEEAASTGERSLGKAPARPTECCSAELSESLQMDQRRFQRPGAGMRSVAGRSDRLEALHTDRVLATEIASQEEYPLVC